MYVLITTDHGMHAINTLVSLERLLGSDLSKNVRIVTSGPVANLYLMDLAESERAGRTGAILHALAGVPYIKAWEAGKLPAEFHYADASRIGSVVALLDPGYGFSGLKIAATQPSATERGMHGYDPACPEMHGAAIVWRYRHPMAGVDLGTVVNTQWHATVARLLGIRAAEGADGKVVGGIQ